MADCTHEWYTENVDWENILVRCRLCKTSGKVTSYSFSEWEKVCKYKRVGWEDSRRVIVDKNPTPMTDIVDWDSIDSVELGNVIMSTLKPNLPEHINPNRWVQNVITNLMLIIEYTK